MKLESTFAVVSLAFMSACGGSAGLPPPGTPHGAAGVTEAQPAEPVTAPARPEAPEKRRPYLANVLTAARSNDAYRRVLFTGYRTQLALMTIPPFGDIGFETHGSVEQIIFVAEGRGKAILDGAESPLVPGDVVVIPPGTRHDIFNAGVAPLRIYTVYAPPNHLDGRVHPTKADATTDMADEIFGRAVR